jgi:hypothetical protein
VPDVAVERPPSRLPGWFLLALALLAVTFFALGLHRANWSTLRGDEIVTLEGNWRGQPLGHLILTGAVEQFSPAPLMYVADFVADHLRVPLRYLGLSPPGYARLPSLFLSAGLGVAAALAVALRIRRQDGGGAPPQYLLVLCGLAVFLFHPKVFAFAGLERPYGLWNGLWFFLLAWLLGRPPVPRVPLVLLLLLAATATAACFQILALGMALVVVRRVERRPATEMFREAALLLALPALIGAYYALRSIDTSYEELTYAEKMPHFLRFWLLSNLHVWIAGGAMTFLALRRPALRELAIPAVALTALMLVMPLIFSLSHLKGYSMVSRQYIWTSTAVPLALFFAAIARPELRPTRYLQAVAVVAALAIVGGNVFATFRRSPLRNDSRELALLEKDSPLMTMLKTKRPRCLLHATTLGDIEAKNLTLIAEWIQTRYARLPADGEILLIRDVDGRLTACSPDVDPGEQRPTMRAIPLDR